MADRIRKLSQIFFLLLFLGLFLHARFPYESGWPSDIFLRTSPLVALTTAFSARTWIASLLPAVILLLLTIPLGRFFCGWICPLGTVIDGSDSVLRRRKPAGGRESVHFRSWKFFILIAVLCAALFSWQAVWFFDPLVMLTRVLTLSLYPAMVLLIRGLFQFGFASGLAEEQWYTLYDWTQKWLLPVQSASFEQSIPVLLLFIGVLALGLVSRRFWCRNLCPLGALLGFFSRFRVFGRSVNQECTSCSLCQRRCRMNAIEDDYTLTNTAECIQCAECATVCKPKAISYRFGWRKSQGRIDLSRRRFIQATATGIVGLAATRVGAGNRKETGWLIRPPGALPEAAFLDRCIRCQACVRICSSTGACLQPALTQGGWEGVWSPRAVMRTGYCEYNCTLCGQICPTGAIRKLNPAAKQLTKMGTAYFDKSRCIPWYRLEDCLVCEEHCPLPEKAIRFDEREVRTPEGEMRTVKFPYVREDLCIGCGICENKCPVVGQAAIFVTTAGEERQPAGALAGA